MTGSAVQAYGADAEVPHAWMARAAGREGEGEEAVARALEVLEVDRRQAVELDRHARAGRGDHVVVPAGGVGERRPDLGSRTREDAAAALFEQRPPIAL